MVADRHQEPLEGVRAAAISCLERGRGGFLLGMRTELAMVRVGTPGVGWVGRVLCWDFPSRFTGRLYC